MIKKSDEYFHLIKEVSLSHFVLWRLALVLPALISCFSFPPLSIMAS